MKKSNLRPAFIVAVLALTGCSGPESATDSAAKTEKDKAASAAPAVPVTAKTAFWEMYKPAHAWAPDMLPLTMEAKTVNGIKNEGGKAAMWQATFGSASLKQFATFTYSITVQPPDIRKGVVAGEAVAWGGPSRDAMPFQSSEFAIDSDEAYKIAQEKANSFLKEHPDIQLSRISLGAAVHVPGPVWSFVWGDKKLGFIQVVSATTGKALK